MTNRHGSFDASFEHASPVCLPSVLGVRGGKCDQLLREFLLDGVQLIIEHGVHVDRLLVDHTTDCLRSAHTAQPSVTHFSSNQRRHFNQSQLQPFDGPLFRTIQVSRYQKVGGSNTKQAP